MCRYGNDCRRPDCWFRHPDVKKVDYSKEWKCPVELWVNMPNLPEDWSNVSGMKEVDEMYDPFEGEKGEMYDPFEGEKGEMYDPFEGEKEVDDSSDDDSSDDEYQSAMEYFDSSDNEDFRGFRVDSDLFTESDIEELSKFVDI